MNAIDPQLKDFILFCAERRGKEWPGIYDEMARAASERLFRGLGYDELKQLGLSLAASKADTLLRIVEQATTREAKF